MGLYLVLGGCGLPVFAGGGSGWAHLVGPTGGFLLGFVPGAAIAGAWVRSGRARAFLSAGAGMLLAHATILLAGWAWLALSLDPSSAWQKGVAPFLGGALLKSLLAAIVAYLMGRRLAVESAGQAATGV